jgi:hypothetical protein
MLTPVPEPSSLALVGLGGITLLGYGRTNGLTTNRVAELLTSCKAGGRGARNRNGRQSRMP